MIKKIGYVDTYIVVPPGVYGTPQGTLAEAGIQNSTNGAFTALISASFKRGAAGIVGEGKNITGHVDVTEGMSPPTYLSLAHSH